MSPKFSLRSLQIGLSNLRLACYHRNNRLCKPINEFEFNRTIQTFKQALPFTMPPSLAEYDSEFSSGRRKGINFLPTSKTQKMQQQQQRQFHHNHHHSVTPFSPSPLGQEVDSVHSHRKESSTSANSSAPASRSTTATSTMSTNPMSVKEFSLRASEIQPTADIANWAHQTHIKQGRSYSWCQGCFPPEVAEPLNIPKAVEKVMTGRRVRINEASHAYDI